MHKSLGPSGRGYELIYANYFSHIERSNEVCRLSRSSFCEARNKLSWEAFAYLQEKANLEHNEGFENPLWKGHRVRAVDGTCIQLPRGKDLVATFPERNSKYGASYYPYSYLVAAADVFTCQTTHTVIGNKYSSERDQLRELLSTFNAGDISILDRGFDGKTVWKSFDDAQQFYLGRLRVRGVSRLNFNENLRDQVVETTTDSGEIIKIRIVRGKKFKTGNHLFLATNLFDRRKYSRKDLLELYKKRQAVEDVFLHLKHTLKAKNIRSKNLNGALQEIYAALTMTTIVAGLRYLYELNLEKKRISFKAFCWRLETGFCALLRPMSSRKLSLLFDPVCRFTHTKQPGRSYPRCSRQPASKWIAERIKKEYNAKLRMKGA